MNKEELEKFEKQVYENQEQAIKLLNRCAYLSNKVDELEKTIDEQDWVIGKLKEKIKELRNTNEDFDPYIEYGVSENWFH